MIGETSLEFEARRGGAVQRRFAEIGSKLLRSNCRPGPFDKDELSAFLKISMFARDLPASERIKIRALLIADGRFGQPRGFPYFHDDRYALDRRKGPYSYRMKDLLVATQLVAGFYCYRCKRRFSGKVANIEHWAAMHGLWQNADFATGRRGQEPFDRGVLSQFISGHRCAPYQGAASQADDADPQP